MAKKPKGKSPDRLAAQRSVKRRLDLEAVNIPQDMADLETAHDVEVTRAGGKRDGQKVKEDQARRVDAFHALREGMAPGSYDAARRLEVDLLTRVGAGDRGSSMQRVDCDTRRDVTDVIIEAGKRVDAVLARIGDRDAWLLMELFKPASLERPTWRHVVHYVTGETTPHGQGAAVRSACANLAAAYVRIDESPRRAA